MGEKAGMRGRPCPPSPQAIPKGLYHSAQRLRGTRVNNQTNPINPERVAAASQDEGAPTALRPPISEFVFNSRPFASFASTRLGFFAYQLFNFGLCFLLSAFSISAFEISAFQRFT